MSESVLQSGKDELLNIRGRLEKQEKDKKRAEELAKSLSSVTKELDIKKKAMNYEIDSTMKARKAEIESTYNKEITELSKNKKKVQTNKAKEKSVKVSERVGAETEEMQEKIKSLKHEIRSQIREYKLPGLCRYKLFYALFLPRTVGDILILILFFVVFFLALPCFVFTMLNGKPFGPTFTPAIVYAIDIILFGGAYMLINNLVKDKHNNEIKGIVKLRKEIRQLKKSIRLVRRGIEKDSDESEYGLEAYDVELAEMEAKLSGLSADEKSALETFNTETKPMLTEEIKRRYMPDIDALQAQINDITAEHRQLSENVRDEAIALSKTYDAQLGKSNMNLATVDRLLIIIESGAATTIGEALVIDKANIAKTSSASSATITK